MRNCLQVISTWKRPPSEWPSWSGQVANNVRWRYEISLARNFGNMLRQLEALPGFPRVFLERLTSISQCSLHIVT